MLWRCRNRVIDLSEPVVMGILNVTPDSFSDGGRYASPDAAFDRAARMVAEGAAILDVGGESTRPGALGVDEATELERVLPVIERIARHLDVAISIDTSKPGVMAQATGAGACIVNDVYALRAPGAREWAARAAGLGAGEVLRAYPWAQVAMRWLGAAYLLWLAWQIATARPIAPETAGGRARPLGFWRAALFQWINPKAWVISVGGVVTYASAGGSGVTTQAVLLGVIFLIVTLPSTALWTLIGVGAARLLRTPAARRRFNVAMAALLVASLVPMFLGE